MTFRRISVHSLFGHSLGFCKILAPLPAQYACLRTRDYAAERPR
jgi:hypothetical protein